MPNPKTLRETQQSPQTYNNHGHKTPTVSLYEQSREERIKENLQRMQNLGILDLSDKLKSRVRPKRTPKHSPSDSPGSTSLLPSGPRRRSSRLQSVTPVSYSEGLLSKKDDRLKDEDVRLEPGSKPEVYREEDEKLLGNTEKSWTLFVDGYGQDGKRIYDPVKGKTCHQCRQKTLGHRTQCCKCSKVQGQFCGDCLYIRYGEHVLEANENPNWICPVCRGICNCSLCRQAKGWCPTGPLYKKILNLGFKSVAHYLIQTQRFQTNLEKNPDTANQASAKRSLSFKDTEAFSKESGKVDKDHFGTSQLSENQKDIEDLDSTTTNHQTATKRSLSLSYIEADPENNSTEVDDKVLNHFGLFEPQLEEDQRDNGVKDEQEKKLHYTDEHIAFKSSPKPKKKRAAVVPSLDSIAGRLRQRRRKVDGVELTEKELEKDKEMQTCDDEHGDRNHTSDLSPKFEGIPAVTIEPNTGRRPDHEEDGLTSKTDKTSDVKQAIIDRLSEEEVETNKKHVSSEEAGPDNIARR